MVREEKVAGAFDIEGGVLRRRESHRLPPLCLRWEDRSLAGLLLWGDSGMTLHSRGEPLSTSYSEGAFWRM